MKAADTVTLDDEEYGLLIENTDSDHNIELECVLKDGNPLEVDEYAWFKDGELLEDCRYFFYMFFSKYLNTSY